MVVRTFQDFYTLIQNDNISIKYKLKVCIDIASKTCICQKELKQKRLNDCNKLYVDYVRSNQSILISLFKNKTKDKHVVFLNGGIYPIQSINIQ